jgi:hypothetical protein
LAEEAKKDAAASPNAEATSQIDITIKEKAIARTFNIRKISTRYFNISSLEIFK